MISRIALGLFLAGVLFVSLIIPAPACCPAPPPGKPVVNADQSVIILWDAAAKTQHFIRQASFKSDADDFGFLVPSPTQPELDESGNDAFAHLTKLTAPDIIQTWRLMPTIACACPAAPSVKSAGGVTVLSEKLVAGFRAAVLETASADALIGWLKDHGYAYSPEVRAWAKPYVDAGWKITAFKVAKDDKSRTVAASALRMSFRTDAPLFPYREPDPTSAAAALRAEHRILRIYFLGDARYVGNLGRDGAWGGRVVWSDRLASEDRSQLLTSLRLPETTGPAEWHLTEFEDDWPYKIAPADLSFSASADQSVVRRPPFVQYRYVFVPLDVAALMIIPLLIMIFPAWRLLRRQKGTRRG